MLAQHEYRHITPDAIRAVLGKFVGAIEQAYPGYLTNLRPLGEQKSGRPNKYENNWPDLDRQTVDETEQISPLNDDICDESEDDERLDMNNNNSADGYSPTGTHPTLRIKQCHSIELLEMDDATIRMRVLCDGLFSCRSLVRDLGHELGCHASLHTLHLRQVG